MVVLRVVLEHLFLLLVVEGSDELVKLELLAPVLAIDEPARRISLEVLRRWKQGEGTYIFSERATSNFLALRNRS